MSGKGDIHVKRGNIGGKGKLGEKGKI